MVYSPPNGVICLDEVRDSIAMPVFDARTADAMVNYDSGDQVVDKLIVDQLREYVAAIASLYRDNPFHNFDHACHVTMSVNKLLKRIVTPGLIEEEFYKMQEGEIASRVHDFTYGIISDPMAVFAIVFSALIHDVDHRGVSNIQLIKEHPEMGELYRNKSVAEQNSVDLAWDVLMSPSFSELRNCIFGNQHELLRFRQLVVNVVLATDIFDKELNDHRRQRWQAAFAEEAKGQGNINLRDLRATIVMEHIIQASDISHTMQHWHIYQKWNKQLFNELYAAYRSGRMGVDPSVFWYRGELDFFDNYIIPLARKLKECNVFGVSSDEYLNYALLNRAEWEERGPDIVNDLMKELTAQANAEVTAT